MGMVPAVHYRELIENPQHARPTTLRFEDHSWNLAFTKRQLNRETELLDDTPDYRLYRTGEEKQSGWILLYNKHDLTTDFAMNYRSLRKNWLPALVTSNWVYSNALNPHTRQLAGKIFFNVLLGRFRAVLSDGLQTDLGQRFWLRQMTESLSRGFRIALVDMNTRQVNYYDPASGSLQSWLRQVGAYGDEHKYRGRRLEIMTQSD